MSDEMTAWLRGQIGQRMGLARHAIESEACVAEWTELCSGVLATGPPTHDDTWDGTHALGDSRLTRLMAANDPRDTIARCEAELAILDEHAPADLVLLPAVFCRRCLNTAGAELTPCRTVRLVAYGYRYWPGWLEEWKDWKP